VQILATCLFPADSRKMLHKVKWISSVCLLLTESRLNAFPRHVDTWQADKWRVWTVSVTRYVKCSSATVMGTPSQWKGAHQRWTVCGAKCLVRRQCTGQTWWSLQSCWLPICYRRFGSACCRLICYSKISNYQSPPRPRRPHLNLHSCSSSAVPAPVVTNLRMPYSVVCEYLQRIEWQQGNNAEGMNTSAFMPVSKTWLSPLIFTQPQSLPTFDHRRHQVLSTWNTKCTT